MLSWKNTKNPISTFILFNSLKAAKGLYKFKKYNKTSWVSQSTDKLWITQIKVENKSVLK